MERSIDQGLTPKHRPKGPAKTFGDMIDLHVAAMFDVGRSPLRSKDERNGLHRERISRSSHDRSYQ